MRDTVARRFAAKLLLSHDGGCWVWQGCITTAGYGQFSIGGGRRSYTHRFAYTAFVGPIPDGLVIDHLCRNRACCNPAHLEVVTIGENTRRGVFPPHQNSNSKTHCKWGHEFTPENTRTTFKQGWVCRVCVACARDRSRMVARRKREAFAHAA